MEKLLQNKIKSVKVHSIPFEELQDFSVFWHSKDYL